MSMEDITYNVEMLEGALWPLTLFLTDDDDVAIDLTNFAVFCEIRDRPGGTLLASPTVQTIPATGYIYIHLTPVQTKNFGAKKACVDVLIVDKNDPTNIRPLIRGDMSVWAQITKIEITTVGDTTVDDDSIVNIPSTSQLVVGMSISGGGVPDGSTIASITDDTSIVSSQDGNDTQAGTTLVFTL